MSDELSVIERVRVLQAAIRACLCMQRSLYDDYVAYQQMLKLALVDLDEICLAIETPNEFK